MKWFIRYLASATLLLVFAQNCAKNDAVHLETIKMESMSSTIEPIQTESLPPMQTYKSCTLQDGTTVPHLYYSWGLKNNTESPTMCDLFEVRQCFDGILNPSSGTFNSTSCNVSAPPSTGTSKNSCVIDGRTIAHEQIIIVYKNQTVTGSNNCVGQVRRCINGTLTGNPDYSYFTCGEDFYKPANNKAYDCSLNGAKIPDGSVTIAFKEQSPKGTCTFEPRRCIQGRLSGSYAFSGCDANAPSSNP